MIRGVRDRFRAWPRRSASAWAMTAALAVSSTACSVPLMTLPAPGAVPAADGADALAQATVTCRTLNSISAEIGVSGRVGGRRLRTRLLAGLAAPASAFLDAPAPFGASIFMFAASGNDATLLLPRDRRVLEHGMPADVLEAITGVPLAPDDLRLTLTGCADAADAGSARQIGNEWRVIPGTREIYLRRAAPTAPWQLVASIHRQPGAPEWRAEYKSFRDGLPASIRLASADGRRFDLQLSLSDVERNPALDADTFRLRIPAGFEPITLEELRDAGPAGRVPDSNE